MARLRLLDRLGRAFRFSPEGREVRVWTHSRPGEEDAVVVDGRILEVTGRGAVVQLGDRQVLAVPSEQGWGLHSLWFGFIAVDAYDGDEPLGKWWVRLGSRG